jgi:hypothetical protein
MFNDSFVDRSKFVSFSAITKSFCKDVAYILFYRKKPPFKSFHQAIKESAGMTTRVPSIVAPFLLTCYSCS